MLRKAAGVVLVVVVLAALSKAFLTPEPTTRSCARFLVRVIDEAGINARLSVEAGTIVLRSTELGCLRLRRMVDDSKDEEPPGQFMRCIHGGTTVWEKP